MGMEARGGDAVRVGRTIVEEGGAMRRGALEGVERVLLIDVHPSTAALLASMYPSVFPVTKGPETVPPRLLGPR
jgi:hypothetical protein